jgi:uncharacterized membrane protein
LTSDFTDLPLPIFFQNFRRQAWFRWINLYKDLNVCIVCIIYYIQWKIFCVDFSLFHSKNKISDFGFEFRLISVSDFGKIWFRPISTYRPLGHNINTHTS